MPQPVARNSLNRQSTAQQVASLLSGMIFDGVLRAGEPLRESALAASIGVARNTVREAVRILERGALVTYEVNRGSVVSTPRKEAVAELYRAREIIETAAARQAPDSQDLENLAIALGAFRRAALVRTSDDLDSLVLADLAFHKAIVGILRSRRISEVHDGLCEELRFYMLSMMVVSREYDRPDEVIREHEDIFTAVAGGDRAKAELVVSAHLRTHSGVWMALFPAE